MAQRDLLPARSLVRAATVEDLEPLVELTWAVAAEGGHLGVEVPFDRDERRDRLAGALKGQASALFVADASPLAGPAAVGYAAVTCYPFGVTELSMLLDASWRRRGLGAALLEAAIDWSLGAGAHKMSLEVWPHNKAAIALYRRRGFVEEGRRVHHYRRRNGDIWDSLIMGLQLGPAPLA